MIGSEPPFPEYPAAAATATTPLPRLIGALAASVIGFYIALLTPLQLLLTLHLTQIAGSGAAVAFGTITGIGALVALVANPLAGRISDRTAARFGRRRTWILTGSLVGALVIAAMSLTTEVWQVAIVWCAAQGVMNFQWAATTALLADQVPPLRRSTVSGLLGLFTAAGPLIGLAVVSTIGDPVAQWLFLGAAAAAGGILCVVLLRDPQHRVAAAALSLKLLATSFWVSPRRHPAFGWAWLVRFLITCAYASSTYTAFYLLDRFDVGEAAVGGLVLALSAVLVILLSLSSALSGFISDRLRRQKPFVIASGLLCAAALVMMAVAPTIAVVFAATGILGFGVGLFFAIDSAMCVRVLPSTENAGKDLGVIAIATAIPQSFVPFIAPALLALGGFTALYLFLAVLGVLGALAVVRIPELGREGDPRFALITTPAPAVATATA